MTTVTEPTNLKPCPFCGSTNIDPRGWASTDSAGPACDDCGASAGGVTGALQDNIEAWNRRATTVDSEKVWARQLLAKHYRASEYPPMVHEANSLIHGRLCRREQAAIDAITEARLGAAKRLSPAGARIPDGWEQRIVDPSTGNYFAPDGTLMNADGTRSIFDDVDNDE